jgi:hypothetical protein
VETCGFPRAMKPLGQARQAASAARLKNMEDMYFQ